MIDRYICLLLIKITMQKCIIYYIDIPRPNDLATQATYAQQNNVHRSIYTWIPLSAVRGQQLLHRRRLHPSCCVDLSRKPMAPGVAPAWAHAAVFTAPHHDGRRRSTSLSPQCRSRSAEAGEYRVLITAAWSYQRPTCEVHLCLPCGVKGKARRPSKQSSSKCFSFFS